MFLVPVTSQPNQTIFFTATINGSNMTHELVLKFVDDTYWTMDILDHITGTTYLTAIPLVPGESPAQNILEAYDSLRIGSAYIVPTDNLQTDGPITDNLGTNWVILWMTIITWSIPNN